MKETLNMMKSRMYDKWIWGDLVKMILAEMLNQTDEELNEIPDLEQELKKRVHYFAALRFLTNEHVQKKFQQIAMHHVNTLEDSKDIYSEAKILILDWPLQAQGPIENVGALMRTIVKNKAIAWWKKYLKKYDSNDNNEDIEKYMDEADNGIINKKDLKQLFEVVKNKFGSPTYEIWLYRSQGYDYGEIVMLLQNDEEKKTSKEKGKSGYDEEKSASMMKPGTARQIFSRLKTWLIANYPQ